jgi:uncharacterized protein YllA (UPF0747 family)
VDPSVYSVYLDFIWRGNNSELARTLYDTPPLTLDAVCEGISDLMARYRNTLWHVEGRMKQVEKILTYSNRDLACLTPEVVTNIGTLRNGAIESAHQTVVMGGPAYVLNKAATARHLVELCADKGVEVGSFFCLADYDIVQPELTNIRVPVMGSGGTLVSIPIPEGYENSPVSILPLPPEDWYTQSEDNIRESYRPMFKGVVGTARIVLEERLEQALSIIRWSFINSSTLGEWAARILGRLFNIEGRLGLPLVVASSDEMRDLLVEGAEFLLARENRERFLTAFDSATRLIQEHGYNPGIGLRGADYVPFFYECPEEGCNRARAELHYEEKGGSAVLSGKCPTCSEKIEIETSADTPFLGDVARSISLRVDSRQIVINSIIPTVVHVGGPGETAYYAQVIPSAKALDIPFPMFVKYPRVYFNTPWNEQLAKSLEERNIQALHRREMFTIMGSISKERRKSEFKGMNEKLADLEKMILESHSDLNERLREIGVMISESSGEKMTELLNLKMDVERYLSWTFGQYAEEKFGQESSWAWIEWAINAGFSDLFGPYQRAYVGPMKNGATLFVNFSL